MNFYTLLRSLYRRINNLPLLGPLVVALRHRRFPVLSGASRRYSDQQNLLEAHGQALSGLRNGLARIENEMYAQLHRINMIMDKQRNDNDHRLEFIRREMFFEFRYGLQISESGQTNARILNPEKVNLQKRNGTLRLNVGCGHKPDTARINIDARELPQVDIVAQVDRLPFAAEEVQEIYSAHLLEHFPHEHLVRKLLPLWCKMLSSSGELRAVVPDSAAMLEAYARQEISFSDLRVVMYGGQEYQGDFHHTMFTPESLAELFVDQGLENVRIEARHRRNGLCYECEVVGTKP